MLDHQRGKAYPRSLEPLSLRDPSYALTMTYWRKLLTREARFLSGLDALLANAELSSRGEMCRPADGGRRLWTHDKRPDYDDIRGQPDDEDRLRESTD